MYDDAIKLLTNLVNDTPNLKGLKIQKSGKIDLHFSTHSYKAKNAVDMLEHIESKKEY